MNKKILALLEGDKFLRIIIENKLSSAGYHIDFTFDCDTCIDKINEVSPHLLLIDIHFNDGRGIEIIEEMKNGELRQAPKILALYDEGDNYVEKLKEYDISEYLLRNHFTLDELLEKVNKILLS